MNQESITTVTYPDKTIIKSDDQIQTIIDGLIMMTQAATHLAECLDADPTCGSNITIYF